jgi:hypothetical protein
MKKVMFRSKYSQATVFVLFIFVFLCFSPKLSYSTAPKSVDLAYDMNTQTLSVIINHPSASVGMHHIESVEIKKNGTSVSINKYGTQPADSIVTYTYKIPAAKGDVFEVTATCNMWGHKTSKITLP